jgi:formylglycine-generating enzyme required for sulfatase activity
MCRALLLCLGEYRCDRLPAAVRSVVLHKALAAYRKHPDPGVHSAAEWLLLAWNAERDQRKTEAELKGAWSATRPANWYIDRQGHTLVVIDGADQPPEVPQAKLVSRTFAIATKEVTVEQFLRYLPEHPYEEEAHVPAKPGTLLDRPVNLVSWYQAAAYCRWLSRQEGVTEDQMCYPPIAEIKDGMRPYPDYLSRTGYRLPTDAEWELACRARTWTTRYCGEAEVLLPHYAWYAANSGSHLKPVGQLKPNDLGLFDMLGNAMEWCQDGAAAYERGGTDDVEDTDVVLDGRSRVIRGTTHHRQAMRIRVDQRDLEAPNTAWYSLGFRVARTRPRPGP